MTTIKILIFNPVVGCDNDCQFKQLDEEFEYFREHAIENPDEELPFPHPILK